jgi:hypothetical protein
VRPLSSTKHIFRTPSPAELAETEREVMRKRDLRAALATSLGARVVDGAEFKQLVRNLPASATAPVVSAAPPTSTWRRSTAARPRPSYGPDPQPASALSKAST